MNNRHKFYMRVVQAAPPKSKQLEGLKGASFRVASIFLSIELVHLLHYCTLFRSSSEPDSMFTAFNFLFPKLLV